MLPTGTTDFDGNPVLAPKAIAYKSILTNRYSVVSSLPPKPSSTIVVQNQNNLGIATMDFSLARRVRVVNVDRLMSAVNVFLLCMQRPARAPFTVKN
jgi:hypothetical protein